MATHVSRELRRALGALRYEPVSRRIRCHLGEVPIFDTTDALLVWEPRQVVPNYAVPESDFLVTLIPYDAGTTEGQPLPPVISPYDYSMHSTPGQRLSLVVSGQELTDVAFRPADPDIGGRVTVKWMGAPFDWMEEDQHVVGHPHDPFSRIDVLRSDRHVVVSLDGVVLADSERPTVLYETGLPPRWYLPREDVRMDLLESTDSRTVCAYKGFASYFSVVDAGEAGRDVAWTYLDPLHEVEQVRGLVCFFSELTDLEIDGEPQKRPRTYWSRGES
jgi:uncharacterized protein (DUF427 family)